METYATERMKTEYDLRENEAMFRTRLRYAAEQGLLLFVKYALVVGLIWFSVNAITNVVAGSVNGSNALNYLNEAISKGYLPKTVNGQVPPKMEKDDAKNSVK